jgi:type II restriction enzyme
MQLHFDPASAVGYKSESQRARKLTEAWFEAQMYCVACGHAEVRAHPNNARANDFSCSACAAHVELKSASKPFGATVPDGAFLSMMDRLRKKGGGPHLALLHYCPQSLLVRDLLVIPAPLLTESMILPRKPLSATARRAGWQGCNIRIADVPDAGRVEVVTEGRVIEQSDVVARVRRATRVGGSLGARNWLVDTLRCVERLGAEFSLEEIYGFEHEFRARYPKNAHVREKLRQQLQKLRDAGFIVFLGGARYRRALA